MKVTWVFLLAVGVVAADVGLGYHYKVPQTSYGVPSYQIGGNSGQYSSAYAGSLGSGSNTAYQGAEYPSTGYQAGALEPATDIGTGYYQSSGASSSVTGVPAYLYGNSGLGGLQSQYSSSNQYQAAEQQYEIQQQPAQVFKHFYVHSAPEEPEPPKPRTPIVLPPPQKHYKIIFVKTPTESRPRQPIIPVQPQNEEKTIVYVLVKKPEEQQEVVVPKVEQKPPSKPEVFFIKYKNKEDSQAVIENIVKDYDGQQVSILNPGLGGNSFNSVSGVNDVAFNTGTAVNDIAFNSASGVNDVAYDSGAALSDVSYESGAGLSGVSYNSGADVSDTSYNAASEFGNVQYDAPTVVSSTAQTFGLSGNEGSAYSLASANSGADLNEATISSTVAAPVTVSSTASSIDYDGASAIPTSQGVPHETYGTPKFRV